MFTAKATIANRGIRRVPDTFTSFAAWVRLSGGAMMDGLHAYGAYSTFRTFETFRTLRHPAIHDA